MKTISVRGQKKRYRIGADVGGTFTDVVLIDGEGNTFSRKVPSSPPDFEKAVLHGIEELLRGIEGGAEIQVAEVAHGTTVATNAVLERRGAKTALITTEGFRDVFELRRLRVPHLFNLFFEKPPTLVERHLRFEVPERMSASGEVLKPLEDEDLERIAVLLEAEGIESAAVCLLHSYAFPGHEAKAGAFLRKRFPAMPVSVSCEILRERKEYERTATTVVNAYVQPIVRRYVDAMNGGLKSLGIRAALQVMQSNGGLTPDDDASRRPVYILESGPAAGVLAARFTADRLGLKNVLSFDMGGTTAKASLIENGLLTYSPEYEVGSTLSASSRLVGGAGELIRVPTIDIAEVGAGGGSIAYLDSAGSLHVGPRSAGAVPGPVCYGRGGADPTLTDANAVLGYIRPGRIANGDILIDPEAAERSIADGIARPLDLDMREAAFGIHRIANAATMRALKEVSTQRGRDPRQFTLIAFGGSGPIQAAGLGRELHVAGIIIPPAPGLFSAAGLLVSDTEHHDIRSCKLSGGSMTAEALEKIRFEMQDAMNRRFRQEGYELDRVVMECSVDMRYEGQFSEIRIPLGAPLFTGETIQAIAFSFGEEHERMYGHRAGRDQVVEITAVRLVGRVPAGFEGITLKPARIDLGKNESRPAFFGGRWGTIDTPVTGRVEIAGKVKGPLLIDEYDSTIVVPPDMTVRMDNHNNLLMEFIND